MSDDVATVVAHQSTYVVVIVGHIACHAAELYQTVILSGNAAHLGIARATPVRADIGTHPAVADGTIVFTADAAHQTGVGAMNITSHMKACQFAIRSEPEDSVYLSADEEWDYVIAEANINLDADGVALTVEFIIKRRQRLPIHSAHVEVG